MGSGADRVGLQLYGKYYQQTVKITNRFVVVDVPEGQPGFKWSDSYDSSFQMEQNTLAFEKANVLFNAAAILSQQAAALPTATAEDLNGVFGAFQASASILHYVKEHFLHPPLHDISKPSLEFLAQLMQAQAQEAAAKKAVLLNNASSAKIMARLWQSSAVHFSSALKFWYSPNAGKLRENVQESVPQLIDQKFRLSTAFSLYYAAQWSYSEERVGEAIARCMAASKVCEEAGSSGVLARQFAVLKDDIMKEYIEKLEKENGLIFHDPVPSVIPDIEPASLVSLLSIEQALGVENEKDLFSKVIPRHFKSAIEKFKEEADKLVNYESHLVESVKKDIQRVSHEIDSIDLFGSPKQYLFERLEVLVRRESALILKSESCSELHSRCVRLKEMLKAEVSLILDSLQDTNKQLFDISSITPDERRDLLEKVDIIAAIFESTKSQIEQLEIPPFDGQVARLEEKVKEYSQGQYEQSAIDDLPANETEDNEKDPETPETKVKIDKSSIVKAEEAIQKLKEQVRAEDISEDLANSAKGAFDEVVQKRIKKFDPLAAAVETAVELAKQEVTRVEEYLSKQKSKAQSNAAFRYAEEQIEKRKNLINVYRGELLKIRYGNNVLTLFRNAFEILQTLKSEDLDIAREEYKKLEETIKEKRQTAARSTLTTQLDPESQALKDREYMLNRLCQLGITPDRQ